ncbi:prepilin-type N-terminal cleavage/methylation domain-containing protein [Posidoniimonas corsicana]|uniref:prepilin-type N-terminal cleavage/methylation domain-containing protein n=1 Tax=Posidoniimonas corsicana TaxID=1938618 RepID=UPI0018D4D0B1
MNLASSDRRNVARKSDLQGSGFTLVESQVVIVIIGILSAPTGLLSKVYRL